MKLFPYYNMKKTSDPSIKKSKKILIANIMLPWTQALIIGMCFTFIVFPAFAETETLTQISLAAEELAYVQNNPIIRVHAEELWPPYNFIENDKIKGFSNEYMDLIARKVGLRVEYVTGYSWDEFMGKLARGDIDVISNMVITEDRRKFAIFSEEPIFSAVNGLLLKRDSDLISRSHLRVSSLDELEGRNLAIVRGYFFEELLKKHYPKINLLLTNSTLDAMKQVDSGNADAALETHATFNYYINNYFLGNLVSVPLVDDPVFSKVAQQHLGIRKESPMLKSILDKAMDSVSNEELSVLLQRWFLVSTKDISYFTDSEIEFIQSKSKISYCVDPDWFPLEAISNGKHVGVSADFLGIINQKIGISFVLVPTTSWTESLYYFKERHCDILPLAVATPQRRAYADFTQPYLSLPLVLVNRNNEPFIADLSKIVGQKIGMVEGYGFAEVLPEKYPLMQFEWVSSLADGLDKVKSKELFGFVDILPTVSYALQKDYHSLKIAGTFDSTQSLGIAVRNDEPLLLSVLDKAINFFDDNTHKKIMDDWTSVRYDVHVDYALLWRSIGLVMLFVISIIAIFLYRQHLLKTYNRKLEHISSVDRLTGCCNRLKIDEFLEHQVNLHKRYRQSFSIILSDIDYFKNVNDQHGHLAGDKILIEIAEIFKNNIRNTDLLGRWGGEEFIIICPQTSMQDAKTLAESLRNILSKHYFEGVGFRTASFGVMEYLDSQWTPNDLIKFADDLLYKAKEQGRNCVMGGELRG